MSPGEIARRQFLRTSSSTIGGLWIAAALGELTLGAATACTSAESPTQHWQTFSAADAAEVEAMAALIMPGGDTPGAREARVIVFIDRKLASFSRRQRPLFEQGLADLRQRVGAAHPGATSFAALDEPAQLALLHALERDKSPFFEAVRVSTIVGMFANPEYGGNLDKSGWKLLGFEDRFAWQPPFGYYDAEAAKNA
jgi:gluconate 2-dehydrogenase gamma chain